MKLSKPLFEFENGRWSFTTEDGVGWKNMSFEFNGLSSTVMEFDKEESTNKTCVRAKSEIHGEEIRFEQRDDALVVTRRIANIADSPLRFQSVRDGMLDDAGIIKLAHTHEYTIRYMHSSNIRTETFPDSRPEYPLIKPIPYTPNRFGNGECNHFPAFVICDEASIVGGVNYQFSLVEGDLDQTRFEREWSLGLDGAGSKEKVIRTYSGTQRYSLSDDYTLAPGESLEVSCVYYQILRDVHPQNAFKGYVETLDSYYEFYGEKSPMRHGAVFCTWNFGTLDKIDENIILNRSKALAENVPECTHFLIDDGYQANRNNRNAGIDSFYPVPENGFDERLFPNGMRVVADGIRGNGQEPCIWLSPKVYLDSRLAIEKPEWLLRDANGAADVIGESSFLDISVPEAKAFLLEVFDALFVKWGFKGLKFDFMTHWFTMESLRFARGGSGPEWRDFVFSEIRKRVGDDGLFMTCIAMSSGNPFVGRNADCYRCGCDIHDCSWWEQLRACQATLAPVLLEGRKTLLLNMDSAGFGKGPENEQLFRLTWVFITQGILELGGPIETMPKKQLDLFRKLLKNADRGHKVTCLDERAFTGAPLPEMLKVDYPDDSVMAKNGVKSHIAFFNWDDRAKYVGGRGKDLGISPRAKLKNYWTDAVVENEDVIAPFLEPHSAFLLEVGLD